MRMLALSILILVFTASLQAADQPNILLIVADDLGYSDLGCYGSEIATPNLDALAYSGIRLTQFYNAGRCCPSRASILTGQYPHRVGLGHMTQDIGRPGYRGWVSADALTIAQVLKPAGYRSFIAGKWHLGTADPTAHGFEEFYGTLVSAKRFFDPTHLLRLPQGRPMRSYLDQPFYATDAITDHALDFLNLAHETPDRPWFLYLAHPAPHFPLQAPKGDIQKYNQRYHAGWDQIRKERCARMLQLKIISSPSKLSPRSPYWNYGETDKGINPSWNSLSQARRIDLARRMAIYAAMIDRMDQQIGRIITHLQQHGEFKNTLIIFLSDNGACAEWDYRGFDVKSSNLNILHQGDQLASMGSSGTFHSAGSGWANASNTPWRLYKHFVHEGGINSPCIVHWPAGLKNVSGQLHRAPAHVIDLLPTCLAVGSARYSGRLALPGMSLVDQIRKQNFAPPRTLYFEHESHRGVREGNWKLVALKGESWELYDFTTVRTELENIAAQNPNVVKRLSAKWDQWASEHLVTPLPKDYRVKYLKPSP